MWNPWRSLRSLADWTLHWTHLPDDLLGITDFETKSITLAEGMTQAQRRCTIAHELEHVHRGPVLEHHREREERRAEAHAARRLLPDPHIIAEALVWSRGDVHEAAEALWVDEPTLRARLDVRHLHPAERAIIVERVSRLEDGA